jgi:flagellar basal-body rod modification protein FlgD
LASSSSYLGKQITITTGNGALQNSTCTWRYALGADASSATINITDSTGKVVYTAPASDLTSGGHDFTWDGQDNGGNQLTDGVYKMSVTASTADGTPIQSAIAFQGTVDEINLTGTEPLLMIGPMAVPLSQVSAIDSSST